MNNDERDEVEQAAVEILRAVAWAMPFIVKCVGIALLFKIVLSAPFEVSCKTVEVPWKSKPVLESPLTNSKGEIIATPMKPQAEE